MKKALLAGSFDPPTIGHMSLIKKAVTLCDRLYVGVGINASKSSLSLFTVEERLSLLKRSLYFLPQIEIISFSGLAVDCAKEREVDFLIRGIRNAQDFEYESHMALLNREMDSIETVFFLAEEKEAHISSSRIKELAGKNVRLKDYIPEPIEEEVFTRLQEKKEKLF